VDFSPWEIIAVLTGIGFLLLAVRENPWCWVSGGVSTAIFGVLFWRASLYSQSLLQVYYVAVSAYGWWHWRGGSGQGADLPVRSWPAARNAAAVGLIVVCGLLSGYVLDRQTDSEMPYLDALTTWGGVVTTWMAARKILENWLYWLVINAAAIVLYAASGLYITTGLYAVYFVLALFGYARWKRKLPPTPN